MDLYAASMFGESPLTRAEREMLAVVVSARNACNYCLEHHSTALNHYWNNEDRVRKLAADFRSAGLSSKEVSLCALAEMTAVDPSKCGGVIAEVRALGVSDREIHDAVNVAAYFNYVNRIVLSLGVDLESEGPGGYKY